jgi:hypothetical protein
MQTRTTVFSDKKSEIFRQPELFPSVRELVDVPAKETGRDLSSFGYVSLHSEGFVFPKNRFVFLFLS